MLLIPNSNQIYLVEIETLYCLLRENRYKLPIDIDSLQDCAHWFGIDSYRLPIEINSLCDCAHWFGIDSHKFPIDIDQ